MGARGLLVVFMADPFLGIKKASTVAPML